MKSCGLPGKRVLLCGPRTFLSFTPSKGRLHGHGTYCLHYKKVKLEPWPSWGLWGPVLHSIGWGAAQTVSHACMYAYLGVGAPRAREGHRG
eukprot:1160941-Pelagomonas_calceolata.AAC.5